MLNLSIFIVFQMDDLSNVEETGFKAHYFATIDAHGQDINRLLVTDEGEYI